MNNNIEKMKKLVKVLNDASYAYYGKDNPIMSDKEYDDLYDELLKLEEETGCVLAGSPTQKVQGYVLDGFKKIVHSKPMLSANKTKDIDEIKRFLGKNDFYCSYKLDGLTLVVRYKNGEFVQGITRGSGVEGEDVTEQCRFIKNLPMKISNTHDIELRGECVISWDEFHRINSALEIPYSHPRNLAAGTLRNLDLNIVKERELSFVVFEMVSPTFTWKSEGLSALENMGFEVVSKHTGKVEECVETLKPNTYKYPVDGLIFEIDNTELSKSLGNTSHHENCRMALKWLDEVYETVLRDIKWNMGKTGSLCPVVIFDSVKIDGTEVSRASVHNLSMVQDLQLGIGDVITVYKANMIIPQIAGNLTRSNTCTFPDECPICGGLTKIVRKNDSKVLMCDNPNCKGKLLGKLTHFVSKNAANIDGLSEQTLQKLIDLGWLQSFKDIYHLSEHKTEMMNLEGFGRKSVEKLLDAIEKSRNITLDRFLYSLSIEQIGRSASKDIAKYCHNSIDEFTFIMQNTSLEFAAIDGIGVVATTSLDDWWNDNSDMFYELMEEFAFEKVEEKSGSTDLTGKIFVITGSLNHYKNRDELVEVITSCGGKVSGSVSAKTNFLINNDKESKSSKNIKAQNLSIPIISEEDFLKMIGE